MSRGRFAGDFGESVLLRSAALLLYAAAVCGAFHLFVLLYEEPMPRRQFPDDNERFRAAVPRWLPRLRPWRAQ